MPQNNKEKRTSLPYNFVFLTLRSLSYYSHHPLYVSSAGLSAQSDASAAAASLLSPNMPLNNLVTLAAMAQQQPSLAAAAQPTAAQLTNAATSLCKYLKTFNTRIFHIVSMFYAATHTNKKQQQLPSHLPL